MTLVVTFVVTFGSDFWLLLLIGIGDWDGGWVGDMDWVVTFVVTFVETFGCNFWL